MAGGVTSYQDLTVWQHSMELVTSIYALTRKLPDSEKFGLVSQMQRAAVSVPANIAEGHGSGQRKVFIRYLLISRGSLMELGTYSSLLVRLGFCAEETLTNVKSQSDSVARMLNALIRSLRSRDSDP